MHITLTIVHTCRSESPSQVFLMVIRRLYSLLQQIEPSQWKNVIVCYDNMCHLDCLRAAQRPLPLPHPYNTMWQEVTKIIDSLHITNHKDERCLEKYSPSQVKEDHPHYNTMVCEQTFVWLSRYKKIVCSMPKNHHLFFIHRMVKRRNRYTERCYALRKKPLLPGAKV